MLKSIATARGECTMKYENMASYNTHYIVPDLIDLIGSWLKSDQKTGSQKQGFHGYEKCYTDKKLVWFKYSEAVVRRCSVKKVLLEISQNSQENTCARVSL